MSSATVSPANGSYAPKQLTSPSNGVLHKSQSVGADLVGRGEDPRNGKRKLEDGAGEFLSIDLHFLVLNAISRHIIHQSWCFLILSDVSSCIGFALKTSKLTLL